MRTRFKLWWRLVGSAVEHAAGLTGHELDFRTQFQAQEEEDEDSTSLAEVLEAMAAAWPEDWVGATTVCDATNSPMHPHRETLRGFFCPTLREDDKATPKSVGRRLKKHVGEPVRSGERTLILKSQRDSHAKVLVYAVMTKT